MLNKIKSDKPLTLFKVTLVLTLILKYKKQKKILKFKKLIFLLESMVIAYIMLARLIKRGIYTKR